MDDYKDRSDEEINHYMSNKIKRCRKCGKELDHKEIYYSTDRVCNHCKGWPAFG